MRSKWIVFFSWILIFLGSCNIPDQNFETEVDNGSAQETVDVIWNLGITASNQNAASSLPFEISVVSATSTPQLVKPVNFEEAFSSAPYVPASNTAVFSNDGRDSAQWLYFSPAEYTNDSIDKLYAAFLNTGEKSWTDAYMLDFYAGVNPSKEGTVSLNRTVQPGEQAVFEIPVTISDMNWKACWYLMDAAQTPLYDFCYSHGNGNNTSAPQYAQSSNNGTQWTEQSHPFTKHEGTAPARYSDGELSAEFVSTSPETGHDFKAYDHYEEFSVSFQNNGSAVWDSSYSLVFYSGYNWMHTNSFSLSGAVEPGEIATITMPMEIYEDNDRWVTCWYLSAPDGKNLADFCFNYYTSS